MKAFSVILLTFGLIAASSAAIGSDLVSTLRIVKSLCYCPGDHSDPIAARFFGCYDQLAAADKQKFVSCQQSIFGTPLDTKVHVDVACRNPLRLPSYASCLKTAFGNDAQMDAAILTINKCQAAIFNLR
ncbi:uncharacterized protein LOC110841669 [Folsomia candida]|uniref:Uncharacterized protein n=1 Tax=Folsomia candida TaxID=158441 RepID=A0A226F6J3_FOLCA|nr:uncharacterized protein LOC110841669 [Folsomia candida]OXA64486.1 hypothetical protein Fcan01_00090 [Folsomia candida]